MMRSVAALFVAATLSAALPASAQSTAHPAAADGPIRAIRVLLLYAPPPEAPGIATFTQQLRVTLRQDLVPARVEFYEEYLDLVRFRGQDRPVQLDRYFAEKYRGFRVDAIVTVGAGALAFATDRFRSLFSGVPIVFALPFARAVDTTSLPRNVTGRLLNIPLGPTLAIARRLQPDAKRLVLIGGATPSDSDGVASALTWFDPVRDSLELVVLQGLPIRDLLERVRTLPPRTIVFFVNFELDGDGKAFMPADVAAKVATSSNAPVYGYLANWLGHGIVGGALIDTEHEGRLTAGLVAAALRRSPGSTMPAIVTSNSSPAVDWRQLQRWHLAESRLPQATEVRFRAPTTWERYRTPVIIALALFAAQALLIGRLLVERRQRLRAQAAVENQLAYVAHAARVATVGELAATLAHELRQPLAAIRLNAQAGSQMLAKQPPDIPEVTEILADIASDDARAADVIDRIGAMLRREGPRHEHVDLNDVCRGVRRLLQSAAAIRRATIDLALDPALPGIMGDPVQLQQVVLNLVLNGLEATSSCDGERRVVLGTSANNDNGAVELSVRDSGRGVAAEVGQRVFEPFFSTKEQGLGMGLAIARSIVERHGGRVRLQNHASGGALFSVMLPRESPHEVVAASYVRVASIAPRERAPTAS